jgi:integrase
VDYTTPLHRREEAMAKTAAPAKPYPEFPLFAHAVGQWAKKIKGKLWYFGVWANPDDALRKYLDEVDQIQAGRDPRRTGVVHLRSDSLTVYDLCNLFLERQQARANAGDVSNRHFSDCLKSCRLVTDHFGKFTRAASLRAADFKALREAFPSTWGPIKTTNEIQRIRTVFKWAAESELIDQLPNFGPDFKKPSRAVTRRDQQQRQAERGGKLDFSADEIQKLLKASEGWLHACILLGMNGGMGNADCGRLSTTFLNLESGWYDLARHKTGVPRRFQLWPETVEAISTAMMKRPIAKDDANDALCFLTSHGKPVWWETTKETGETYICDNITKAFTKLCATCGITRAGRGFYSLRRTFETVAGATKDQVAVDYSMGHFDESMAAVYRQGIDDQRLTDVGQYVHDWLFPKEEKKKPTKKTGSK